jgi:hypothetical protein
MFGTIKKAMVVAAVAGAGVAAVPAMASAGPVWNTSATSTIGAEAAHAAGNMTTTATIGGAARTTTCHITFTADLWNATDAGTTRGVGEITTFSLEEETNCTTNIPGCAVSATANTSTPWNVTSSAPSDVTISGVNITNSYSGVNCPLNGASINATGSITGSFGPGVITFTGATGLTTPLGPATVDGELEVLWEDDSTRVELS